MTVGLAPGQKVKKQTFTIKKHIMEDKNKTNKTIIECECGTHLLMVQEEKDYYGDNNEKFHQSFYLAMFSYGNHSSKDSIWRRIKIAWDYLRTGEMFRDQLVLNPDEASKLSDFLISNMESSEKVVKK